MYDVLSTGGDTFRGGVDFDRRILDHLVAEFSAGLGPGIEVDAVARQRLSDAAERAKRLLSEQWETRVQVPYLMAVDGEQKALDVTLTRARFEELCAPLVNITREICAEVL